MQVLIYSVTESAYSYIDRRVLLMAAAINMFLLVHAKHPEGCSQFQRLMLYWFYSLWDPVLVFGCRLERGRQRCDQNSQTGAQQWLRMHSVYCCIQDPECLYLVYINMLVVFQPCSPLIAHAEIHLKKPALVYTVFGVLIVSCSSLSAFDNNYRSLVVFYNRCKL